MGSEITIERNETDWIHCFVREARFEAFVGVKNLQESLHIFKKWITSEDGKNLEALDQKVE